MRRVGEEIRSEEGCEGGRPERRDQGGEVSLLFAVPYKLTPSIDAGT